MLARKKITVVAISILILITFLCLILVRWRKLSNRSQAMSASARYEDARKLIERYIIALHDHNSMNIRVLVPNGYDAQADIDDRLEKFGGIRTDMIQVDLLSDITPDILSVYIKSAKEDGQAVQWTENLVWREGQWWLVLGSIQPGDKRSRINR